MITLNDSTSCKTWFYNCTLSLKCIHDFFDKIPLVKGAQLKITLNINQCSFKFVKTAEGVLTLDYTAYSFPNGVCPLMISSCGAVQADIPILLAATTAPTLATLGNALVFKAVNGGSSSLKAGTYHVTASICKNMWSEQTSLITGGVSQSTKLTQTRLYVPAYSLKAEYEDMYMKKMKKTVTYVDTFMKEFQELTPGMDLQLQITSSVTNPLRLIIIPMASKSSMGTNNAGVREQQSPFSSSPATTCPCTLSNFQVLVSGIQIYNQPAMYSYEQYMNEVHPSGMSYGLDMFAGSGQMSLDKWINNYGYYVINLERRLPDLKVQACSLDIAFRIDSLLKLDFIVFVETEKSMTIDLLTGGRDA